MFTTIVFKSWCVTECLLCKFCAPWREYYTVTKNVKAFSRKIQFTIIVWYASVSRIFKVDFNWKNISIFFVKLLIFFGHSEEKNWRSYILLCPYKAKLIFSHRSSGAKQSVEKRKIYFYRFHQKKFREMISLSTSTEHMLLSRNFCQ